MKHLSQKIICILIIRLFISYIVLWAYIYKLGFCLADKVFSNWVFKYLLGVAIGTTINFSIACIVAYIVHGIQKNLEQK